jgi:hypothetical protein
MDRKNMVSVLTVLLCAFACFGAADFDNCGCAQGQNTAVIENKADVTNANQICRKCFYKQTGKMDLPPVYIEYPPK